MASKHGFPIYIISKGRAYNPLTAKNFEAAGLNYLIAVEPQERDQYVEALGENRVLVLPFSNLGLGSYPASEPQERDQYVEALGENRVLVLPFSNLGLGSYPARNYCWEHAKKAGHQYHWLFDDNITDFKKWIDGKRKCTSNIDSALLFVESFVKRHNIDIGGFEEPNFVVKPPKRPFKINCHVYSAMLIKNSLPYRWRLKYNEDVDLCLQVLHNKGMTASCVYYMADKISTVAKMKGGNQDELYKGNDPRKKLLKAKMLEAQWPQYAKTVIRFNRIHHLVDWRVFQKKEHKTLT